MDDESNCFDADNDHSDKKCRILEEKCLVPDGKEHCKGEGYPGENVDKDDHFGVTAEGEPSNEEV